MVGCNERVKIGSTTLCESIMTSIKKRKVVLSHAASILHYLQAFEDTIEGHMMYPHHLKFPSIQD
jgi:hypothetical protein